MEEVEGILVSPRTFESPGYDRVTHDSLLEKCRRVFDGRDVSLGNDKNKKKALRFDKDTVTKAGETFFCCVTVRDCQRARGECI